MAEELKDLELIVPVTKVTWIAKMGFVLSAREALRRQHNEMGRRFRENEITEKEWDEYVELFAKKSAATSVAINDLKFNPPAADLAEVDLENNYQEKA